jgi:hypothetical protein
MGLSAAGRRPMIRERQGRSGSIDCPRPYGPAELPKVGIASAVEVITDGTSLLIEVITLGSVVGCRPANQQSRNRDEATTVRACASSPCKKLSLGNPIKNTFSLTVILTNTFVGRLVGWFCYLPRYFGSTKSSTKKKSNALRLRCTERFCRSHARAR